MRLKALRTVIAAVAAAASNVALVAQAPYSPPKTPWGDPDLQGIWPSTDIVGVPFEQPERFGEVRRSAIALNGSFFSARRMLLQYLHNAYQL